MVGFYCVTSFQILMSILIKEQYFSDKKAVIYLATPLDYHDYNMDAFKELGFEKTVCVSCESDIEIDKYNYEAFFFFSIFCAYSNRIKMINKEKMILGYEGITTYQLKNWEMSDPIRRFNIMDDIDEIWVPDKRLIIDAEYLNKVCEKPLTHITRKIMKDDVWIARLNSLYKYEYRKVNADSVFMDRYLSKYSNSIKSFGTERILTGIIYNSFGQNVVIKRHPYDTHYLQKYKSLKNVTIYEENVPWEIVYMNNERSGIHTSKYIIYNSFAPINMALLFGDTNFQCVCVEPVLDAYACIENTYLDAEITKQIFELFSEKYEVKTQFINSIAKLDDRTSDDSVYIDNQVWKTCENIILDKFKLIDTFSFRGFRLQVEVALHGIKRLYGTYCISKDNISGRVSSEILQYVLPDFEQTEDRNCADWIIDTDLSEVNYDIDDIDVDRLFVLEGCARDYVDYDVYFEFIKNAESIFIWGATKTNYKTCDFLQRMGYWDKVKCIFDSNCSGELYGKEIRPFDTSMVTDQSAIFVCANLAHPEICKILEKGGFKRGKDFILGIGIA